jgi:hypothetical protein
MPLVMEEANQVVAAKLLHKTSFIPCFLSNEEGSLSSKSTLDLTTSRLTAREVLGINCHFPIPSMV